MTAQANFSTPVKAMILAAGIFAAAPASAIPLLTNSEGTFGDLAMAKNDDGSSSLLALPFTVNFFGNEYNSFFINNNGNVTFNGRVSTYTPHPFPTSNQPMIAPYWADVDTRCGTCGNVFVDALNDETVIVTWHDVGHYSADSSNGTNDFQLVLRDASSAPGGVDGDFDVEFRYNRLEWTTGNASGGVDGLGGTPAQAGYDAGDGENFFSLPGSRTGDVLELQNTSNVSTATPGLWSFAIRNGALPGETPDNPLMPTIVDGSFEFDFNIELDEQIFIDPVVSIGYDYEIASGPSFDTVLLPVMGDNMYDLWLWDTGLGEYVDSGVDLTGGVEYAFLSSDVYRFRIMGIEESLGLDPTDGAAFVTGLTFNGTGRVQMSMIPVTVDTGTAPIPGTLLLLSGGLAGMFFVRRRKA